MVRSSAQTAAIRNKLSNLGLKSTARTVAATAPLLSSMRHLGLVDSAAPSSSTAKSVVSDVEEFTRAQTYYDSDDASNFY